jgi:hypothetical protein
MVCGAARGAVVFGAFEWYVWSLERIVFYGAKESLSDSYAPSESMLTRYNIIQDPLLRDNNHGDHSRPAHPQRDLRQPKGISIPR